MPTRPEQYSAEIVLPRVARCAYAEVIENRGRDIVSHDTDTPRHTDTAFIVQVPYDETSGCLHLGTAKHVADAIGADFDIGFNGRDGKPLSVKNGGVPCFFYPTEPDSPSNLC
jgi:hypothetical protein